MTIGVGRREVVGGFAGAAAALMFAQPSLAGAASRPMSVAELTDWEDHRGLALVDRYPSSDQWDSSRVQAAINDAIARGLGGVLFSGRDYDLNQPVRIPPVTGFLLQGVGGTRFLRNPSGETSTAFVVSGPTGSTHENIRFDGLTFFGGMQNMEELGSNRARGQSNGNSQSTGDAEVKWKSGTLRSAISAYGDRTKYWDASRNDVPSENGVVRNVTVSNCVFLGIAGLPVFFRGVRGAALLTDSVLRRCLDPGWVYCESAQFIGNRSEYSMDNGASLSRGCDHAVAVGNTIYGAWFNGIWVAGFQQDPPSSGTGVRSGPGPKRVTVTGNVIEYCGEYGINATDSVGQITISGNSIFRMHPTSSNGKSQGVGIVVSEWTASDMPRSVTISGNTIEDTARGGIIVHHARSSTITGNTMRLMGSDKFPDGSARNGSGTQRFGISYGATATLDPLTTVLVVGNTIADQRGAAAATHHPIFFPAGGKKVIQNNLAMGCAAELVTA